MRDDTKVYPGNLRGVGCEVESCKFHCAGNLCNANKITVESELAVRKAETFCSTFAMKSSM